MSKMYRGGEPSFLTIKKKLKQPLRAVEPTRVNPLTTVEAMKFTQTGNRLFMIMETEDDFSFDKKTEMDANNPKVQAWENLMRKYQEALPMAKEDEKWLLMDRIFKTPPPAPPR